ncbi:hypothetical protein M8J77_003448 [Diaphorina citri]|nr:hypothetical protein M8J77_003448 [Diaphorina citri]
MNSNQKISSCATFLTAILESFGAVNPNTKDKPWKNKLQAVYCFVQQLLVFGLLLTHFYYTVTRSINYTPEFIQRIFQDIACTTTDLQIYLLSRNFKRFEKLIHTLENSVVKPDKTVLLRFERKVKIVILSLVIMVVMTEMFFLVNIPFIDETEYYEVCFFIQLYLIIVYSTLFIVAVSYIPIMIIYLIGQYKILCKYIVKLGSQHHDLVGKEIFYTDIETNGFTYSHPSKIDESKARDMDIWLPFGAKISNTKHSPRLRKIYQKEYLKQIIKFHQKLLIFQKEMTDLFEVNAFVQTSTNFIVIALCLHRLTSGFETMSFFHLFKCAEELSLYCAQCYFACYCSDLLDDCNIMICTAIRNSKWINCDSDTRKDIWMLLRRAQRPNILKFGQGFFQLRRELFLKVVKIAYNFVSFMRIRAKRQTQ